MKQVAIGALFGLVTGGSLTYLYAAPALAEIKKLLADVKAALEKVAAKL